MAVSIFGRRFSLNKTQRFYQQIRTGYIVLLPEVSPDQFDKNPLYKNGLPDVENLNAEKCLTTLGKYLLDFEQSVRDVEKDIQEKKGELDVFESVLEPLEESGAALEATWGLAKALYVTDNKLMPSRSYIIMHDRARKARSMKYNSHHIYNMFKNCDVSKLTEEEQRVINKFVTEGKLNGLDLQSEKKENFTDIFVALANEKDKFRRRVQISRNKFRHTIHDPQVTRDFPEDLIRQIANDPENSCIGPWDITLTQKIVDPVLKYCPDRQIRWNTWLALRQVASSYSGQPPELNNSKCLEKIRSLRRDLAQVLGYKTYMDMSMETKMAKSVEVVQQTLDGLLEKVKTMQEKEINKLQEFASEGGFDGQLEMWDVPYWERKQKLSLLKWDERKINEYFPLEKVLTGLMNITSEAFGLRFELAKDNKSWHPDIRLYNIYSSDSVKPVAGLYVDLYARQNKIEMADNSGLMIGIRPVARILGPTPPLAALVFNFPPPRSGKEPCLLDFTSVENLFKKFGHALQQLLSNVNYSEVSGLSNIEWDAVEVVTNFMSKWLEDPKVLSEISGHYSSNEPLPVSDILPIRKHMLGYHLSEEIYLANLDIQLHTTKDFWLSVVKNLWPNHFVFPYEPKDAHPLSFLPAISGELSGAYYSRLWAKILAADAYDSFKNDADKAAIGLRFRDTFLGFGGACHPSEVFRRFQGRDPSSEVFERQLEDS